MDCQFREIYRCNIFIILPYMEAYYHKYFLHDQFSVEWGGGGQSKPQNTYRGRVEIGGVYLPSKLESGEYPTTLYVMVDIVKGGGRAPPPSPGWADFSIMMEWNVSQKVAFASLVGI
jgi:hypothetical protein